MDVISMAMSKPKRVVLSDIIVGDMAVNNEIQNPKTMNQVVEEAVYTALTTGNKAHLTVEYGVLFMNAIQTRKPIIIVFNFDGMDVEIPCAVVRNPNQGVNLQIAGSAMMYAVGLAYEIKVSIARGYDYEIEVVCDIVTTEFE